MKVTVTYRDIAAALAKPNRVFADVSDVTILDGDIPSPVRLNDGIDRGSRFLLAAMLLRFLCEFTVALAAFWITRTVTLNQLYATLTFFLAGQVAPLSLFPEPLQIVSAVLPFRWMLAFPVEVILGRADGRDVLIGVGMQAFWLTLAFLALHIVWQRGVRRYSAVGA